MSSFPFEDLLHIAERECCARYPGLRLVPLNADVLRDWRNQWGNLRVKNYIRFPWNEIIPENEKEENRFGWAMYVGKELCGLVATYIETEDKKILNLGVGEGSPVPNHAMKGKILPCALDVAESIAKHGQLDSIQAHRPFEKSRPAYIARGYQHRGQPGADYFEKVMTAAP